MSILWLASLTLMGGVSSTHESNCSYHALLKRLNLENRCAQLAEVRPVWNFTKTSYVMVDMLLNGILEVNEKTQTLTSFVTIATTWNNEFLQWEPEDICGNSRIYVRREKLWLPDITIIEQISDTGGSRYNQYAFLSSSGLVQVVDRYRLTTICKMDLYKFPFDTQTCYITFQSVLNREHEIALGSYFNHSALQKYTKDVLTSLEEWDFLDINRTVKKYRIGKQVWDQLKYKITIERKPLLYIINLVLPITFLLVLDVASFFISEARGEKLGFKVTILLSISVLLLILQDMLPSTADRLPLIALHCIVIFMLTGLSLLETMLVSFLVDMDGCVANEVDTFNNCVCPDTQRDAETSESHGGQTVSEPVTGLNMTIEKMENQPKNGLQGVRWLVALQRLLSTNLKPSTKKHYYRKVAKKVDMLYFCLYFITVTGFMVYMFYKWTH